MLPVLYHQGTLRCSSTHAGAAALRHVAGRGAGLGTDVALTPSGARHRHGAAFAARGDAREPPGSGRGDAHRAVAHPRGRAGEGGRGLPRLVGPAAGALAAGRGGAERALVPDPLHPSRRRRGAGSGGLGRRCRALPGHRGQSRRRDLSRHRLPGTGGRFGVGSDSHIRIDLADELRSLEYSQRLRDRRRNRLAAPGDSVGRTLSTPRAPAAPRPCSNRWGRSRRAAGGYREPRSGASDAGRQGRRRPARRLALRRRAVASGHGLCGRQTSGRSGPARREDLHERDIWQQTAASPGDRRLAVQSRAGGGHAVARAVQVLHHPGQALSRPVRPHAGDRRGPRPRSRGHGQVRGLGAWARSRSSARCTASSSSSSG
jgi:hypothetical protein